MQVLPIKYEAELITVRQNFIDVLPFGRTLVSGTVVASVFMGEDSLPSDLIYGTATVSGQTITQQLIRGIAGVTYTLTFTVVDNTGKVFVKVAYQTILSNTGSFNYGPATELMLTGALIDGYIGVPYFDTLLISGGTPPYLTATIVSGSMPAWMSMNIVGNLLVFTGNPNVIGISIFNPQVRDFAGATARDPQEIEVKAVSPITIIGDLPDGNVGDAWAGVTYTAVGGVAPYTFASRPGTTFPGNTGPMDATGLVPAVIPTTTGAGINVVEATDSLGVTAVRPDPFTIGPAAGVMLAQPKAGNPYASLDGITFFTIANSTAPGNVQINAVYPDRFISANLYSDDLGATPWGAITTAGNKNYLVNQFEDSVIWNSSGPFEPPVYSTDRGLTALQCHPSGNGTWWIFYTGASSILGAGKTGTFVTAANNTAPFVSTGISHGLNGQNITQAQAVYSGGYILAGSNVLITAIRVIYTTSGLAFTGGDITGLGGTSTSVGKLPSRMCVGFVGGVETVVLLGNAVGELYHAPVEGAWVLKTNPLGVGVVLDAINWNGIRFVLGGTLADIAYLKYSYDLVTWFNCVFPTEPQGWFSIAAQPQETP